MPVISEVITRELVNKAEFFVLHMLKYFGKQEGETFIDIQLIHCVGYCQSVQNGACLGAIGGFN